MAPMRSGSCALAWPAASVPAEASSPGYFGVASRSRPLCPYPQYAHYNGSGDINVASSFVCR